MSIDAVTPKEAAVRQDLTHPDFDFPMSQLYRDALDPDVRDIVEQEDRARVVSDLQEDVIDLQRQVDRLAARWLTTRGYYAGQYYPEERTPSPMKPKAKPPPVSLTPPPQPRAKGGMKLPEVGTVDGKRSRGQG